MSVAHDRPVEGYILSPSKGELAQGMLQPCVGAPTGSSKGLGYRRIHRAGIPSKFARSVAHEVRSVATAIGLTPSPMI